MKRFLGIIIMSFALVAMACGGGEFPKQGVIEVSEGSLGAAIWSEMEYDGRLCIISPDNLYRNHDGSMFLLASGLEVEILGEGLCPRAAFIPYQVRVNKSGMVGWISTNNIRIE